MEQLTTAQALKRFFGNNGIAFTKADWDALGKEERRRMAQVAAEELEVELKEEGDYL